MAKIAARLYEIDFVAWAEQTAQQIRSRQFDQFDWDAIAEEIESLGRSERVKFNHPAQVYPAWLPL